MMLDHRRRMPQAGSGTITICMSTSKLIHLNRNTHNNLPNAAHSNPILFPRACGPGCVSLEPLATISRRVIASLSELG
jgi:hypothetical protein